MTSNFSPASTRAVQTIIERVRAVQNERGRPVVVTVDGP